jgi:RND family efflux transporter MFP subunit
MGRRDQRRAIGHAPDAARGGKYIGMGHAHMLAFPGGAGGNFAPEDIGVQRFSLPRQWQRATQLPQRHADQRRKLHAFVIYFLQRALHIARIGGYLAPNAVAARGKPCPVLTKDPRPMSSSIRPLIAALAACLVLVAPVSAQEPQNDIIRPVRLMTVGAEAGGVTRQFFGQVVARQTVDLAFQVGGQIVQFDAEEGAEIPSGELIAQLDLEPFELQLQQAQLQYDQALREVERLAQLTSSVSEVARDDAETQLGLARVALRNAQYSLDNATLHAPFDALVAARNVANYTTVSAGSPVVRLHDMSEIRVEIDVPEVLFQRAGQSSGVGLMARFPSSDRIFPLVLRELNAEASSIGQTYRLTLGMPRPEGLVVLPGSSVTVLATMATDAVRLIVPAGAIRIGNDGSTSVMRFVPGDGDLGTLEEVAVTVEPTRDGAFDIVAGLDAGAEIVSSGAHAVSDGATVRRFTGFAN